ncbi:hypothetical protein BH11PSE10_BH11PSE10_00990 [soil metagenome]
MERRCAVMMAPKPQARMDRLAEQVVAWHNRHPLAKRITIYDVHTIGVVALPFMRSGKTAAPAVPPELIDPVMDEAAAAPPDRQDPAWPADSTLSPPNTNAAQLDALADQEAPLPAAAWLPRWELWLRAGRAKQARSWPVFSERFIGGLSLRRIAALAQNHGYSVRPGQASWPQREVPIDDGLIASASMPEGAWPVEIYLVSAAIDAGHSRTRVLVGRKGVSKSRPPILGRRCLNPVRVGAAALAALLLAGAVVAPLWWPHGETAADVMAAAEAASVASAASSAASAASAVALAASATASAALAEPVVVVAAQAASAASAAAAPAPIAEAAASMPAEAASEPIPDIRPRLVQRNFPLRHKEPTRSMLSTPPDKAVEQPAERKPAEKLPEKAAPTKALPMATSIDSNKPVVALVGPPSASKAEAEALLEKLRSAVTGVQGKSGSALQAMVFQTPEGYRAAVWPFASREEAQLINATLVARGMRTRAVDF